MMYYTPRGPTHKFHNGGGGGGVRQTLIYYTQKNHNFRICLPQNHYFLTYPKKHPLVLFSEPKKIPLFFFLATQKNPGVFHRRPKKSLLAKISDPKNHSPPPLSLKYVSGAPGTTPTVPKLKTYLITCSA